MFTKTHLAVHNIKKKDGESTRAFVTRYTDDTLQILGLHEEQRISSFVHGLKTKSLVEFLSIDLPTSYKILREKTYTWIEAKKVAINGAPSDHKEGFDSERNKKGKAKAFDTQLGEWKKEARISASRSPNPHGSNNSSDLVIIRVQISKRQFDLVYMDSGSSCKVIYEHCFLKLKPSIRSLRVDSKIPLVGFLGEHSWPLGWNTFNTEHKLNEYKHIEPVKQKKRGLASKRNKATCKEVDELAKAGILKGVFCYQKMPFGLKNTGATYQRLVNKVFNDQIGRNLKVYVYDMGIKSASEEDMLMDIQKTFDRLRSINMKLNPKKFSFDIEEEDKDTKIKKPKAANKEPKSKSTWKLYIDGAFNSNGSGVGLMLVSPEGKEYTYALSQKSYNKAIHRKDERSLEKLRYLLNGAHSKESEQDGLRTNMGIRHSKANTPRGSPFDETRVEVTSDYVKTHVLLSIQAFAPSSTITLKLFDHYRSLVVPNIAQSTANLMICGANA
nr:reverse transcriptase domain-containing protein [Tanacetum cinerariifolium]